MPFSFSQIKTKLHLAGKPPRTKAANTAPIAAPRPAFSLFVFGNQDRRPALRGAAQSARPKPKPAGEALFLPDPTAARRKPHRRSRARPLPAQTLDLIASFQHAVVGDLMKKTFAAAESLGARRILITGGVAANRELRARFSAEAARRGLRVAFPTLALSTDNAAMIAAAAWPRFQAGEFAPQPLRRPFAGAGAIRPMRQTDSIAWMLLVTSVTRVSRSGQKSLRSLAGTSSEAVRDMGSPRSPEKRRNRRCRPSCNLS